MYVLERGERSLSKRSGGGVTIFSRPLASVSRTIWRCDRVSNKGINLTAKR
jgi:hypothetical protein